MRFSGQSFSSVKSAFKLTVALLTLTVSASPVLAQTAAPYILPYTMSTFAGPHAQYTPGAACGSFIALDVSGDGCLASQVSVGIDPHDVRVDGQGNVFFIDNNSSTAIIHKISAVSGRMTAYVGSTANSKLCGTNSTPQGDSCLANDGAGNAGTTYYTAKTPKSRGLGIAPNGDLFYADFNGNYDHKVSASTGFLSVVSGTGVANTTNPPQGGPVGTAQVNASRGISADANGNVYIADTGDGNLRAVYSGFGSLPGITGPVAGQTYNITAYNPASPGPAVKSVANGPASSAYLAAPEDVQIDTNGNIYVADAGNNVVRAIYMGKGSLIGVTGPLTVGYIYLVAGYNALNTAATATAYPKDGTTPTFPATNITISDRKISLDKFNNLYIADSSSTTLDSVIWFVDSTTGNIRLLAGDYGLTLLGAAPCNPANLGDGCPATQAAFDANQEGGVSPDNQGNIYLTDSEAVTANGRLRKVLSGLNFPATVKGTPVTQTVYIHFTALDSAAAVHPYVITGAAGAVDYVVGTPSCMTETDTTTDCKVPVTFTPTKPGYDVATLTINTTLGNVNSYLLTGTGITSSVVIDPGFVTVQNTAVKAPQGVFVDSVGNIYTADTGNNRVLFYNNATVTTTVIAGTGTAGNSGDGGQALLATLNAPRAVTMDTSGALYIADTGNNTIRRVSPSGVITTIAGGATTVCLTALNTRGDGCPALQATFSAPSGIAADNLGGLYVSDTGNNLIRAISTFGYVTTLAGGAAAVCPTTAGGVDVYGDGCGASSTVFNKPAGLAYDATGTSLVVADTGDNIVRSIYLANTIVSTAYNASTVVYNPVTLIAGTGGAGDVLDNNSVATMSQLNGPTGVAVGPARNVYIADTGNAAIRVVTPAGTISTIVGVLGGSGTGATPGSAANVQLNAPASVAVTPIGTLQIADSGNNRILTDQRSQVVFNFGRTNIGFSSPVQTFIESSNGTAPATLPTPLLTPSNVQTQFTLVPVTGSTGCGSGTFAVGATCFFQGQFTPAATGAFTTTYTEVGAAVAGGDPSITLMGTGAVLTKTTSTVAQTAPTGNSQFGGSVTLTATVTAATANAAAPTTYPTGTVRFIVDNGTPGTPITLSGVAPSTSSTASQAITGLSVGSHTISCNYSGDNFYASSSCGTQTIVVAQASTTSLLSVTNNNMQQYTPVVISAMVISAAGIPPGTVTFYANGTAIGSSTVNPANSTATFSLYRNFCPQVNCVDYNNDMNNGVPFFDNTLLPGTYSLTCSYAGSANFGPSTCAAIPFTVLPQVTDFTLRARGCAYTVLNIDGTTNAGRDQLTCVDNLQAGSPLVATAQGSTSDATIFVTPTNTLAGKITFACSGLPTASICTFSPTSITVAAGTATALPVYTDMTLWTDLQPGSATSSIQTHSNVSFATLLGWPITILGFAGMVAFRRRNRGRGLAHLAMALLLVGSSLVFTGCGAGGPGAYTPNLTPPGTYAITVTVTSGSISHSTLVYWKVAAPGLAGQE